MTENRASATDSDRPSAADVLGLVRQELTAPTVIASLEARRRSEELRVLQDHFRSEPLGGRLLFLKKPVYWLVASAFDRQAKVVEAMIEALEELENEVSSLRQDAS